MFNNNKLAKSIRLAIAFGAAATALPFASVAAEENKEEEVEKISVTGSRIARTELSQPAPVLTIGAKEIANFGTPDLGSILAELPAIGATATIVGNADSNQEAGISSADLRRLGPTRTLVLVNGKRHVAGSPGSAQVDLSTIPTALIERVEVVTGGASAVYGSDAVTGVVNVILKDNFEGFEINLTGSKDTESVGYANSTVSILAGGDFSDGKGNVTFFAGREYNKEVLSPDLRQLNNWGSIANPENTGEDDGIPDRLRVENVGSEFIHANGVINPFGGGPRYVFDDNGSPVLQTERDGTNSFAFGSFPDGCQYCFFPEDYENYLPGVEKINVGSTLKYDFTDELQFKSDFKYVRADIVQQFQPSFRFGGIGINVQENPFIDEGLRQTLLDGGQTSVTMAKFFDELGNRSADNRRETFRYNAGLEGLFSLGETDFEYEVYYGYGETTNERKTLNDLIPDNFVAAVDAVVDPATGQAACRSQVPSAQGEDYTDPASVNGGECVAFNPFGQQSSQAARDFVSADVTRSDVIKQEYYGANIVFDSSAMFELPGGPVGIALGYEYREESSGTTTDEFTKRGFLTSAATPDSYGEYDVEEVFTEISLPVLSGAFLAEELTLDAAYRSADYSHAGSADSWKVGVMWAPIADLRIRGTYGEAVRAPNISEAFSPVSPGFGRVSDPCDADNINDDPDRVANCAALGIPAGFQANDNVSVDTLSGGNPDLFAETSTSETYGIVWTPEFIEGFTMTVDYYSIEIEDAILEVSAQNIADNCVDASGGPDALYCSQVDRNPVTNDIELVRSGFLNASAFNVAGVEAEFNYEFSLGQFDLPGDMRTKLFVSSLEKLERFEFQTRPDEINVEKGEIGDPDLQIRFNADYSLDDLVVGYGMRYIDESALFDVSPNGGSPEDLTPAFIDTMITHDITVGYRISDNIAVSGGIRNFTDELPEGYTFNALYDLIGRKVFASVNISL